MECEVKVSPSAMIEILSSLSTLHSSLLTPHSNFTLCRFVNDVLHIRKRIKDIFGGHPVEGSHGESVIASLSDSKLFGKVIKGIEGVAGIELLIIFSVAAFYFTIVTGSKGFDFLVPDAEFSQCFLKERQRFVLTVAHFICKFKPIVCLNTLNGIGKLFHYML